MPGRLFVPLFAAAFFFPVPALAAGMLDGSAMGWPWALPIIGVLLSIAAGPSLFPKLWHAHYGKIALAWGALTLAMLAVVFGGATVAAAFLHTLLSEYLSFILLLFALYTIAGGIALKGSIQGSPAANTVILALGASLASLIGTTGAAMILIRPLIKANEKRTHNSHVIVFFIILVANVGGALTPIGDPPLLIGFLRGVDFFWPAQHLWLQTLIITVVVLALFLFVDTWRFRGEGATPASGTAVRISGQINFLLIVLAIGAILGSAAWRPGIDFDVFGTKVELQNILRDAVMVALALLSLWLTKDEHRAANGFTWEPIREVAILFAAIFTAIIPVMAMLNAGHKGAFAFLLQAVTSGDNLPHEAAYFWLTGSLSAFLDNAPTYLVFFELAGGDPQQLMGPLAGTLASISMGAVYMGALTYIGNAPNLMVLAIAEERGIRMPSFFGYMLRAALVLFPIFVLLTVLPISPVLKLW
jgi:Na+/H+ antiporter NhaD/arsenite permease-like protein